jgi:hypothetical protein
MLGRSLTVAPAIAAAILVGSGQAEAAPPALPEAAAQPVAGSFAASVAPCDADLCTAGQLGGDLPAPHAFTLQGAVGRSVLNTRSGQLLGEDRLQNDWTSSTTAPFMTTIDIVGGTGRYVQAEGVLVATGTLGLQRSPQIVDSYTGTMDHVPGNAAD